MGEMQTGGRELQIRGELQTMENSFYFWRITFFLVQGEIVE
jgi:hypothetical protein